MDGHYTIYLRKLEDFWICVDDHKVFTIPKKKIVTNSAYLLFYSMV